MGELAGIPHLMAVCAFERVSFAIKRQGKHIITSNGERTIVIPRNNQIKSFTLVGIVRNAGLTVEQFRALL